MNNYFEGIKTAQKVKDLYGSLSQVLHPDLAGNDHMLAELDSQYDRALKLLNGSEDKDGAEYEYSKTLEADLMARLKSLRGLGLPATVNITINCLWLWVRGDKLNAGGYYPVNTRHDLTLINAGMTFHPIKGEYYYRNELSKDLTSRGKTASNSIAAKYGSF